MIQNVCCSLLEPQNWSQLCRLGDGDCRRGTSRHFTRARSECSSHGLKWTCSHSEFTISTSSFTVPQKQTSPCSLFCFLWPAASLFCSRASSRSHSPQSSPPPPRRVWTDDCIILSEVTFKSQFQEMIYHFNHGSRSFLVIIIHAQIPNGRRRPHAVSFSNPVPMWLMFRLVFETLWTQSA